MVALPLPSSGIRTVAVPLLAVAAVLAQADVRLAIGLPGHRGLLWLTVLVVVALTSRAGTATAVGAASTLLLTTFGATPVDALRYAAAAALLDAALAVPAVRRFPVLLALLAAPIHLVALASPMLRGLASTPLALADRALWHLGFGLVAGLLAWGVVRLAGGDGPRTSPARSACPG